MADEKISKAVILAAGNGSHLRPFSNYVPKPFLPYADKPIIYHHIKNLTDVGIKEIIVITRRDEDNNGSFKLQNQYLKDLSKDPELNDVNIKIAYQTEDPTTKKPRGTADAILSAENQLKGQNYIVILGDLIIESTNGNNYLKEIISRFNGRPMFSADNVKKDDAKSGGFVRGKKLDDMLLEMEEAIEKPDDYILDTAKGSNGNYNVMWGGVYILNKDSIKYLKEVGKGKDNELNITDAMSLQCKKENKKAYGLLIDSKIYKCRDFGRIEHWIDNNLEKQNIEKFRSSLKFYSEEFRNLVYKYVQENYNADLF
ncbi:sugar phosphate nucleotidyltransferase [Candidatus Parvarchaeota archaeon]|nr:sugar phosphate nucleotidyltransferase [Candidatus Parvarchaeota archaeon]